MINIEYDAEGNAHVTRAGRRIYTVWRECGESTGGHGDPGGWITGRARMLAGLEDGDTGKWFGGGECAVCGCERRCYEKDEYAQAAEEGSASGPCPTCGHDPTGAADGGAPADDATSAAAGDRANDAAKAGAAEGGG